MDALRSSFKSYGSYKHIPTTISSRHEMQPILFHGETRGDDSDDRKEVIVKIDGGEGNYRGNDSRIWRESSYDFWKDNEDSNPSSDGDGFDFHQQMQPQADNGPPPSLMGKFVHKQGNSGADFSLDVDLEMDDVRHDGNHVLPRVPEESSVSSRTVSFQTPPSELTSKKFKDTSDGEEFHRWRKSSDQNDDEILVCTSFQRRSGLMRLKTRSRLMDPPEQPDRRSGRVPRSTQLKSGFLGGRGVEDDDDDPFFDEDLPDKFKEGNFSAITLLQWASLFLIVAALVCNLTVPAFKGRTLWELPLWKWEVMGLVLICGRLVSGWLIRVVVFFIEQNFLLRKRVLYFVYGVRKPVQNCIWLGLVLIAWHYIFNKKVERETNSRVLDYVTRVLSCLLVGTLIWLVKTLCVKVLASSFHVSTFFDRIQESLFNQYVIETLSGPPLVEIQSVQEEEERIIEEVQRLQKAGATMPPELTNAAFPSRRIIGSGVLEKSAITPVGKSLKFPGGITKKFDDKISIDHLHKLNNKNVSAWNMKRLVNLVRHGSLSTLDEQILDAAHYDENTTQIRSEIEAKAAARKIFQNVAKPGKKYITLLDLMRFMQEDDAMKTLSLFEGAMECNKIRKSALKNWVVNAFRERRALALTLNDTKTAVNKLHHMINIVVFIIVGVIWLLLLEIATSKVVLFVLSQVLLVAFVFGNTCKVIFESIIFLFVMHPFDVGDRCEIDGIQMVVEEMNILTTVFLRYDNLKMVYPNSVLSTKAISNFYRSPDMGDGVDFCIHISTPADKIAIMKQRITSYIENKKDHWYPSPLIVLKDVVELNKLQMAVWLCHRMNHQDMGEKFIRRALLVEEMVKIFKELDIEYRLFPLDINVRALPSPTSSRMPPI